MQPLYCFVEVVWYNTRSLFSPRKKKIYLDPFARLVKLPGDCALPNTHKPTPHPHSCYCTMNLFSSILVQCFLTKISCLASLTPGLVAVAVEEDNSSDVCSDSIAVAVNDDDVLTTELVDWLRDNGAYINDKLVIKQSDPSLPRGIYAMEDLEAGETICNIPWVLILKPSAEELAKAIEESSDCGTIESVFRAITADDDEMTPYGRYLLNQPRAYTAAFWSQVSVFNIAPASQSSWILFVLCIISHFLSLQTGCSRPTARHAPNQERTASDKVRCAAP